MKNKIENSKKLAWFSGICFALSIIYSFLIFTYGTLQDKMIDYTMIITLITATAAVFGVTMASYMNKGRYENTVKIQSGFLREKYSILKELGVLDNTRAISEIEDEFNEIENDYDNEKSMANQEITYNG
jgi:predicted DNA-binding transcriptional regulator